MDYNWFPNEPDMYKGLDDDERIAILICEIAAFFIFCFLILGVLAMCSACAQ